MTERGVYAYPERGRQTLRFDGMVYENITPTDIDGLMELHGKAWIVFEAKLKNAQCKYGQKLALERFCKHVAQAGKHCLVMIVEHDVENKMQDVFLNLCQIREVMTTENLRWHPPNRPMVVGEAVFSYIKKHFGAEMIGEKETERYNQLKESLREKKDWFHVENELSEENVLSELRKSQAPIYSVFKNGGSVNVCLDFIRFTPNDEFCGEYVRKNFFEIKQTMQAAFAREFVIEN